MTAALATSKFSGSTDSRILADDPMQPVLEDILDFGWRELSQLGYSEKLDLAKREIGNRIGSDIYFEIVVAD